MAKTLYLIKESDGSGGFLSPPGHPHHRYTVEGYFGGKMRPVSGPNFIGALDHLIEDPWGDVPADVKERAHKIMAEATLEPDEDWIRQVYGYFAHSYSPDGVDRNVSNAVSTSKLHCRCGQEFWRQSELDRHLDGLSAEASYAHYAVAKPLPPAEHHLGYLLVREYFPDHTPRADLIAHPEGNYGNRECTKCHERVQYEACRRGWCKVEIQPWRWIRECPAGGMHEVKQPVASCENCGCETS